MSERRILIAGIGNVFYGDDAFGVEVVRRLMIRRLPEEARVVDFGTRGRDLAHAMLEEHAAVILVDAVQRGGFPGTIHVLEIGDHIENEECESVDSRAQRPENVLRMVKRLGGRLKNVYLVGCEAPPPDGDMEINLSDPVHAAVFEAVPIVELLIEQIRVNGAVTQFDADVFSLQSFPR